MISTLRKYGSKAHADLLMDQSLAVGAIEEQMDEDVVLALEHLAFDSVQPYCLQSWD